MLVHVCVCTCIWGHAFLCVCSADLAIYFFNFHCFGGGGVGGCGGGSGVGGGHGISWDDPLPTDNSISMFY